MSVNSLRADGWEDLTALLVAVVSSVAVWYMNDLYLDWRVLVAGSGAGVIVYLGFDFAVDRPVAGFPVAMVLVLAMLAALMIQSLVAGVVAALTVATAIHAYDVYLS